MNLRKSSIAILVILSTMPVFSQMGLGGGGGSGYQNLEKPKFIAVPVPNYNESFGFGLGAIASVMYNVSKTDTISPPSTSGLFGFAASNKTWLGGAWQQFYLKEDTYRITAGAGLASVNFQYYAQVLGLDGGFINYNTNAFFGLFKGSVQTWNNIYFGMIYQLTRSRTQFDLGQGVEIPEETFSGIGPRFTYDSRNNIFYPISGWNVDLEFLINREAIGSAKNYEIVELNTDNYRQIGENRVLASRAAVRIGFGDVPFVSQSIMMGPDLRGYANGKHRADQKYTVQTEYRWQFYKRLGMVGFGGVGWVADKVEELRLDEILPSIGAGIRYMMIKEWHVNVGMDVAAGKDDVTLYFRIGEAF